MLASHCALCGSTGRSAMGVFQTLSAGNMGQSGAPGTGVPAEATPGEAAPTPRFRARPMSVAAASAAAIPLRCRFTGIPSRARRYRGGGGARDSPHQTNGTSRFRVAA